MNFRFLAGSAGAGTRAGPSFGNPAGGSLRLPETRFLPFRIAFSASSAISTVRCFAFTV